MIHKSIVGKIYIRKYITLEKYLLYYYGTVSFISIIYTIVDKKLASKSRRRVSEKTLFTLAGFGGCLAMYITMKIIHHKTRKKRFMLGLPIIIMMHVAILFCFFYLGGSLY